MKAIILRDRLSNCKTYFVECEFDQQKLLNLLRGSGLFLTTTEPTYISSQEELFANINKQIEENNVMKDDRVI